MTNPTVITATKATGHAPAPRTAQHAAAHALANLLALDLPTASWTLWTGGGLNGQLDDHLPLAERQAAVAAWAETLRGVVDLTRYITPTPDHAGNLFVEGRHLGVKVRVWVGLTAADLLGLLGVAQTEAVQATPAQAVADWNASVPVGTPVRYWTGVREGEGKQSRTRTPASVLGGHTAVVWMEGEPSCVALTHVTPIAPQAVTA